MDVIDMIEMTTTTIVSVAMPEKSVRGLRENVNAWKESVSGLNEKSTKLSTDLIRKPERDALQDGTQVSKSAVQRRGGGDARICERRQGSGV
jgi:hypothetical protein